MQDDKRIVAQIRLTPEEQDALNLLQHHYRVTSRSQVLRHLIAVGESMARKIESGYTVWLRSDKEEIRLIFPGDREAKHE